MGQYGRCLNSQTAPDLLWDSEVLLLTLYEQGLMLLTEDWKSNTLIQVNLLGIEKC